MQVNDVVRANCNHCGQITNHMVVAVRQWHILLDEEDTASDVHEHRIDAAEYSMLECGGCQRVSMRVDSFSDGGLLWSDFYPPRLYRTEPAWFTELPEKLGSLMMEIYSALADDSLSLAAMGARTAVDIVLNQKVGSQETFRTKLEALEARGYIAEKNVEVLWAVLDAGSAAAHRGYRPDENTLKQIMDILENLLQAVYIFPETIKEVKRSTPRRPTRRKRRPA